MKCEGGRLNPPRGGWHGMLGVNSNPLEGTACAMPIRGEPISPRGDGMKYEMRGGESNSPLFLRGDMK